jgi:hypothetical protein
VGKDCALVAHADDRPSRVVNLAVLTGIVAVLLTIAPAQAWAGYGLRTVRVSGTALNPTNGDSMWVRPAPPADLSRSSRSRAISRQ